MASMSLQAAYDQARQWLESNDPDRAIGLAQHILTQYPDNLEAYRILGEAQLANRQLDAAQGAFERVLRSDPENIPAHVGLGITYERQGKLDRAIPEFEQALEIKPDMAELRSQLLRLYTDAWGSEHAQLRLSRAGLARLYAKGHMLPQAIGEFRQVIADQPGRFDAMVALAEALWRDGQEDEAIAVCRDILAKRPESLKTNLILGYLEMASGRPEGERFWQAARQMDPYQVVAHALFETLPPDTSGEPMIEEWDEAAWRRRSIDEQREHMPATRPMEAVTPVATSAAAPPPAWRDIPPPRPAPAAISPTESDDFLAGLLAVNGPPTPPTPAPTPSASDEDFGLDMAPFSFDDLDSMGSTPHTPPASEPPAATPAPDEDEPKMTPFSLSDLGLSEEEIAGIESLDEVSAAPGEHPPVAQPAPSEEDLGMQPFSLSDLGLSDEEIAGLDSLQFDTSGSSEHPAGRSTPTSPHEATPSSHAAPAGPGEDQSEPTDLPLDLQPFSLDELDLGPGETSGAGIGELPRSLQPFSLDEAPPQRPRVSGFAPEESFEGISDEEDFIPQTGGYSWQQPSQKPEPGFLKSSRQETEGGDDLSIFAKLKQRRQQEPESPPEAPSPPASVGEDEHLGLFSLDDISLRDDAEAVAHAAAQQPPAQQPPAPPAQPPAVEEIESLQEAIDAGQVQPFSLADLGLSDEEIAALGLGDVSASATTAGTAPETHEDTSAVAQPAPSEDAGPEHPSAEQTAPEPAAMPEEEDDEGPLLTNELKPFSLSDLGLSEEEIAALGLGPSAESDEDISSELGITEEELEGLNLEDPNWSQLPSAAQPPTPAAEAHTAGELEPQRISGDLVVDRLIALGRQQGYVDLSDIISGVEDPEAEAERIEEIGQALHKARVEIRDGDEVIDMDADYVEEEPAPATEEEAPQPAAQRDEEPSMTPFSFSELGLSDEEIAALGLGDIEQPAAPEAPAAAAPEPEPAPAPQRDEEPAMTPFSLSELGLSDEEIAALGLGDIEQPAAPEAPAAPETPAATEAKAEQPAAAAEPHAAPAPEAVPSAPGPVEHRPEPATWPAPAAETAPAAAAPPPRHVTPPAAETAPAAAAPRHAAPPLEPSPRSAPPERAPARSPFTSGDDMLNSYLSRLEAEPQNDTLRLSIARISGQIGKNDVALQQYKQLIKHDASLEEVVDDLLDLIADADDRQILQRLHRLLGDAYSKQGRYQEAMDEYSWKFGRP